MSLDEGSAMQEVTARATLADPAQAAGGGLTTTISRDEIEQVLRADGEPELLLDVTRTFTNGDTRTESRRVAVEWERSELERLLAGAAKDRIDLTIDRASLERAFDEADVEAHGFRSTAAALTIAFATAATGAAAAQGSVMAEGGGGSSGPAAGTAYTAMETGRADVVSGGAEPAVAGIGDSYTAMESGRADAVAAASASEPVAAPGDLGDSYTAMESGRADAVAAAGASEPVAAPGDLGDAYTAMESGRADAVAAAADDSEPVATPAGLGDAYTAMESGRAATVAATGSGEAVTTSGDDDTWLTAPSPETIGIGAAAIALAITGAAFVARPRRREGLV